MTELLWPGDERAGEICSTASVLRALVRVEEAWLGILVEFAIAPAAAAGSLTGLVGPDDLPSVAAAAEAGGNPVIPLVALLRERLGEEAALWLHRGLTSQDVLDTALVCCLAEASDHVEDLVAAQARCVAGLAREHRDSVMAARTLTQYAVPSTFGLKAVSWLDGLASATTRLRTARSAMAVQVGGAAGTLSALAALAGPDRSPLAIGEALADRLGLLPARPWHTDRGTLTTLADALVAHGDAWGRIAGDVALLSRPEIAEVAEEVGGGSSTMPNKANPVLSILVRRHAMWAPHIGALLHSAAGMYVDERPDGAWHVEWDALRLLGRRTVVAASQAADLLGGLRVDAERMAARAREASSDLLAEQRSVSSLLPAGADGSYLGVSGELVDQGLMRAADVWEELR